MQKKVLLKAPVLTQSGYGEHSRWIFNVLLEREDLFDIYVEPLNWGKTGWQWQDTEKSIFVLENSITLLQTKYKMRLMFVSMLIFPLLGNESPH